MTDNTLRKITRTPSRRSDVTSSTASSGITNTADTTLAKKQTSPLRVGPHIIWPHTRPGWPATCAKLKAIKSRADIENYVSARAGISSHATNEVFTKYWNNTASPLPEKTFVEILHPWIVSLALAAHRTLPLMPIMYQPTNVTLTQRQSATIVAMFWLGMFNDYEYTIGGPPITQFPYPTFANVFRGSPFALAAIIAYFARMMCRSDSPNAPLMRSFISDQVEFVEAGAPLIDLRKITYVRAGVHHTTAGLVDYRPDWFEDRTPMGEISFNDGHPDDCAEAIYHLVHTEGILSGKIFAVDEPSRYTYEDVIYCIRPDCLPLLLVTPALVDDAVMVIGAEKYSQYAGEISNPIHAGMFQESSEDVTVMRHGVIFTNVPTGSDFAPDIFMKTLDKLFIGMTAVRAKGAVAYPMGMPGDIQLRFLQFWIAASAAGLELIYYPPARDFEAAATEFYNIVLDLATTVGDVVQLYHDVMKPRLKSKRLIGVRLFEEFKQF